MEAGEKTNFYLEKWKVIPIKESDRESDSKIQQDLHKSTWILLILCELFGCAPFGISLQRRIKETENKEKVVIIIKNIIWSVIVYVCISCAIYKQISSYGLRSLELQKSLLISECLVGLVHITYIIVTICCHHKKLLKIQKRILEFDQQLQRIGINPEYWRVSRFINIHMTLIAFQFCSDILVGYFNNKLIWLQFIRGLFMNTFFNLVACQYYGLLHGISLRLSNLNDVLTLFVQRGSEERGVLQQIRVLYARLEFFTHSVNQIYGFSILLHMLGAIINLSVNVFLFYKCIDNHATCDLSWILQAGLSGCMHLAKVFLILKFNSRIQDQKSITILHLNRIQCDKINIKETITHFLLQLTMTTRSHVVFGVLDLKMEFIISVLLAVTNMFAFLLQYEITFEALAKMQKLNLNK